MPRSIGTMWFIGAVCCLVTGLALLGAWQARDRRGLTQETTRLAQELATTRSNATAARTRLLAYESRPETGVLLALEHMGAARPSMYAAEASLFSAFQETRSRAVLVGHTAAVRSAVFSKDGTKVLTASQDRTARVWEARTGRLLATLSGHTQPLKDAVFCGQDTRIVTTPEATSEGEDVVRLWDAATGALLATAVGYEVKCSPGDRWVAVLGKEAILLDAKTGTVAGRYGHTSSTFAFGASDQLATVLAKPATLQILNLAEQTVLREIALETGEFQAATFSSDAQHLLTTDFAGNVHLWEVATGKRVHTLAGDYAETLLVTSDGRFFVAGEGQTLRVWDLQNGTQVQTFAKSETTSEGWTSLEAKGNKILALPMVFAISVVGTPMVISLPERRMIALRGHEDIVHSAVLDPEGRRALTASEDGSARVWDTDSGRPLFALKGHGAALTGARFSADGTLIVTSSDDGTARIWSVAPRAETDRLSLDQAPETIATDPDGQRVALAFADGRVQFREAAGQAPIRSIATECSQDYSFSRDLRWLSCRAPAAEAAQIWDLASGRRTRLLPAAATGAVWHPSEPVVAYRAAGGGIVLHDVQKDTTRHILGKQEIFTIAFDADGRELAAAARASVVLADVMSGDVIRTLPLQDDSFQLRAYSASKSVLVGLTGDTVSAVVLVDARTGKAIRTIEPERKGSRPTPILGFDAATFLGGGERLFLSEGEVAFRVFDVATGAEVATLHPVAVNAQRSAWSLAQRAGRLIALWTGDEAGQHPVLRTTQLFPTAGAAVTAAKRSIPTCLTPRERHALGLGDAPPDDCITGAGLEAEPDSGRWQPKWPYQSAAWRSWLAEKRRGGTPALPQAD